jgi:hypothetical protein
LLWIEKFRSCSFFHQNTIYKWFVFNDELQEFKSLKPHPSFLCFLTQFKNHCKRCFTCPVSFRAPVA